MRIKIAVCDGDKEVCRYIAEIIARQKPEVLVKTFYTAETLLQAVLPAIWKAEQWIIL